ncbi:CoA ester lyase [Rhodococcus sp. IEGM 1379]|uniref:HpcH/HpaI aldolase/citrate lyase family protein n=1 Tax=Rhodococcus sp. IEGM 1379 TaxID=3047086 RepID=UPI0024B825B2|nr:CoA ester lyase [Rhodococcus sp. IEGM 1379]MDI9914118.1 CoA ester lyase [Rhodococcus sp. IEGM 1379]
MDNNEYRPVRRRTSLVAPGSDERKARKALSSTADEVILDLEDAVTPANKNLARTLVAALVQEFGTTRTVSVRINGLATPWARDDLTACGALGDSLTSVIVPKVETPEELLEAESILGTTGASLQALIETPRGVQNADTICAATPRLHAVVIGYADLGAALGRSRSALPEHWLAIQDRILIACRAAGIAAIDGPFLGIADNDEFRHSAAWTSALGFDGKWVIHPAQIGSATAAFTPSNDAVTDARRVLAALKEAENLGAGAAQLDGQMLDEAVAVAARRVLARAEGVSA